MSLLWKRWLQASVYLCTLNIIEGSLPGRLLLRLVGTEWRATEASELLPLGHGWQATFETTRVLLILQLADALLFPGLLVLEYELWLLSSCVLPWTLYQDLLEWLQSQIRACPFLLCDIPMNSSPLFLPS